MKYVEIRNIKKTFDKNTSREVQALKGIDLSINKGDFIVVIGGNGSGKSTFLNAVAGNFVVDEGSISIEGKDITKICDVKRAKFISRVFQNPLDGTASRMTILENLSLAYRRGEKRGLKPATCKDEIDFFRENLKSLGLGLENRIDTEMGVLSGGQRQSISLLMATLKKPELLLLDEHISALDPKMQEKIMALTDEKIKINNLTSLMITHKLSDALKYGNRLIVMNQGIIVKEYSEEEKKKIKISDLYEIISS